MPITRALEVKKGQGPAPKMLKISVTVKIEHDELIDFALMKLCRTVKSEMNLRWYKRRYSCNEKPSTLKEEEQENEGAYNPIR